MPCIFLTGGGTAGHVTPNLALIPVLREMGFDAIHYIGTADGIEQKLLAERFPEVPFHVIKAGKLRRYLDIKHLFDPLRTVAGVSQSRKLCRKYKPDVIFSKGGFVSLPVVIGGKLAGVPNVLHESDLTPGLANRLAMPYAKVVCTSFEQTAERLGAKGIYTGTPLRAELFAGDAQKGRAWAGMKGQKPVLLVTGGSLGAKAINDTLRQALPRLTARFDVIHLCGKGNLDETLQNHEAYRQYEYVSEGLPDLLAAADIVLSRAGSNTLCELLALCKPHLLVPLPLTASRGDQLDNAAATKAKGFSMVLAQEDMTPDTLHDALCTLFAQKNMHETAMRQGDAKQGTKAVAEILLEMAKKGRA